MGSSKNNVAFFWGTEHEGSIGKCVSNGRVEKDEKVKFAKIKITMDCEHKVLNSYSSGIAQTVFQDTKEARLRDFHTIKFGAQVVRNIELILLEGGIESYKFVGVSIEHITVQIDMDAVNKAYLSIDLLIPAEGNKRIFGKLFMFSQEDITFVLNKVQGDLFPANQKEEEEKKIEPEVDNNTEPAKESESGENPKPKRTRKKKEPIAEPEKK